MGLLDDAIREHLELKRQHGADPDEVARQEQEALGPAERRAEFAKPEGAEAPAAEEPPVPEAEAPVDAGEEREPFDVEALGEPAAPAAEAEPVEPEPEPEREPEPEAVEPPPEPEAVEPPPEPEASEAGYEEDPWLAEERDEVP